MIPSQVITAIKEKTLDQEWYSVRHMLSYAN